MSRCLSLKTVFVMQTAEDWRRGDSVANRDRMAVRTADDRINDRTLQKAGPQTRVWPAAVVNE
jgi:hypothetical protein